MFYQVAVLKCSQRLQTDWKISVVVWTRLKTRSCLMRKLSAEFISGLVSFVTLTRLFSIFIYTIFIKSMSLEVCFCFLQNVKLHNWLQYAEQLLSHSNMWLNIATLAFHLTALRNCSVVVVFTVTVLTQNLSCGGWGEERKLLCSLPF